MALISLTSEIGSNAFMAQVPNCVASRGNGLRYVTLQRSNEMRSFIVNYYAGGLVARVVTHYVQNYPQHKIRKITTHLASGFSLKSYSFLFALRNLLFRIRRKDRCIRFRESIPLVHSPDWHCHTDMYQTKVNLVTPICYNNRRQWILIYMHFFFFSPRCMISARRGIYSFQTILHWGGRF